MGAVVLLYVVERREGLPDGRMAMTARQNGSGSRVANCSLLRPGRRRGEPAQMEKNCSREGKAEVWGKLGLVDL